MRAAHRGRRLRRTALSASSFPRRNRACAISGPGGNPSKHPREDWREYTRVFQRAGIRSSIRCSGACGDATPVVCGNLRGSRLRGRSRFGAAKARNESRKRQAKSRLARGHSIVCHPGRRNCACAILESGDPVHFLRLRSWVPGLASGLARDDNPPVALHLPRVPAGSALGGRRVGRVSPSAKQRVGWRVGIPSFVIPAEEIARAQFWRAGTQYTSFACVPGSRVSQVGSPGMTILRWRCITRAFRPAPRSKRAWGWWGGHAQERECRNAQAKSTGGAASPARSGRLREVGVGTRQQRRL